jgi:hypothetical protein
MKAKLAEIKPLSNDPALYQNGNRMQGNANICRRMNRFVQIPCNFLPDSLWDQRVFSVVGDIPEAMLAGVHNPSMRRRLLLGISAALILTLLAFLVISRKGELPEVRLADGRVFRIEAITFGTNHAVGRSDSWIVPLRKILPAGWIQFITPTRGRSSLSTERPALVVWVHALDGAKTNYVDCQGAQAMFVDEHGDVYPANGTSHGSFGGGFNRQANIFQVFPRRAEKLELRFRPWRSTESSTVSIQNPAVRMDAAAWTPEGIPATRQVGGLEFTLESLVIQTNGGLARYWEADSRHWQPVFRLTQDGKPATNWEAPEWEVEDATGNRGRTLGLHEPLLRFIATSRPGPEAVTEAAKRWRLPLVSLPTTTNGIQWNTNRLLGDVAVTVFGLFPPGAYTFSRGQLTNAPVPTAANAGWTGMSVQTSPGKWQHWQTHTTTNYTAFVRRIVSNPEQRIAVGLHDPQGQVLWSEASAGDQQRGIIAFVFTGSLGTNQTALEIVLLEPLQAEFVVKPPVP